MMKITIGIIPKILASNVETADGRAGFQVAKRATDSTTGGDQAHDARQDLSSLDTILNVTDIRRKQLKTITLIVRAEQLTRIGSEKKIVSPRSNALSLFRVIHWWNICLFLPARGGVTRGFHPVASIHYKFE